MLRIDPNEGAFQAKTSDGQPVSESNPIEDDQNYQLVTIAEGIQAGTISQTEGENEQRRILYGDK